MATVTDRRSRQRSPRSGGAFRLSYDIQTGVSQVVSAELTDFHEEGCGLEVAIDLPPGVPVMVEGRLADEGGLEIRTKAFVSWSRPTDEDTYRVGVQFAEPLKLQRQSNEALWRDQDEDLYELLQISPNADFDTIQRVYRLLAQRYHPDNQETADSDLFRKVLEAYKILSDPEQRAAYDSQYRNHRERRWHIFDQDRAMRGVKGEKAKREGIMGLLYTKRIHEPATASMEVREFEQLLGVPREHLEFSLWYLRERGLVTRSDSNRYQITADGVDQAEQADVAWTKADHLLEARSEEPQGTF
jgi:curved DNA-binding protein CbpA